MLVESAETKAENKIALETTKMPLSTVAAAETPTQKTERSRSTILCLCNFLSKGWEVSILGLLAFLQQKYALPLYVVGILSTVFIISQISISLFAGRIAHALHSRNVILLAIAASASSWLTLFFS